MAMNNTLSSLCAIPGDAAEWLRGWVSALRRFAGADHPYVYLSGSALSLAALLVEMMI